MAFPEILIFSLDCSHDLESDDADYWKSARRLHPLKFQVFYHALLSESSSASATAKSAVRREASGRVEDPAIRSALSPKAKEGSGSSLLDELELE